MTDITRYEPENYFDGTPTPGGLYVLYTDHIAALEAVKATVKPLDWKDDLGLSTAQTNLVACYSVWECDEDHWECSLLDGRFKSMAEAKAAAQADYERRILSAIVPSPALEANQQVIETLRAALEPFARKFESVGQHAIEAGFDPSFDEYECDWTFSFGDLRRAHAALTPQDEVK